MARERFERQERGTLFGEMIYRRIVPKDHFLRKVDEIMPWGRFTQKLVKLYRGEAKENHGLRRCRYVGYVRYLIQACLTAMVLNLKRMVKMLTGVPFKGRARATA